jgi:hypothetical protein
VAVVNRARAQRREPHIVGVGAQLGTEMFLCCIPDFFCRKLHLCSVKKPVIKAFYSPRRKIGVGRWFVRTMTPPKTACPTKPDNRSALIAENFI